MKATSRPWVVYKNKLRPQFDTVIVEIHDANKNPIVKWAGFDGIANNEIKARLIVTSVNCHDDLVKLCNELIEIIKFGKSIGDKGLTEIITNAQKILAKV